jgi:demethylmenaquinone methyltransferase/2-methoxy-6-polyprenyl-1,4-benzoquinol methylase
VRDATPILAEQVAYYRASAGEYAYQADDLGIDLVGLDEMLPAIDAFRPAGDVLELACGTGVWTQHLARFATTVTAVDAAPEMLARARARVDAGSVRFIEADLFAWRSDRRYDAVFFGFWLSHVPEERFDSFWSFVDDCLHPGGRVFFCDDNYRAEAELIEGHNSQVVQRRIADGTPFRIIKVPFEVMELEGRLRALGWDITVSGRSTGARAVDQATAEPSNWAGDRRQRDVTRPRSCSGFSARFPSG